MTSLPSTCSPSMPAAIAFCASVSAAVCWATGTEIAQRLLLMTKTSGRRHTPAILSASATSPFEVAPSPKTQTATRFSRLSLNARATPTACGAWVPTGTQIGKSSRASAKSLPRSSPPQNRKSSTRLTPRHSWAPCSRKLGSNTSSSPHRAGNPDGHRLLTQRRRKGAEPAGPLQSAPPWRQSRAPTPSPGRAPPARRGRRQNRAAGAPALPLGSRKRL